MYNHKYDYYKIYQYAPDNLGKGMHIESLRIYDLSRIESSPLEGRDNFFQVRDALEGKECDYKRFKKCSIALFRKDLTKIYQMLEKFCLGGKNYTDIDVQIYSEEGDYSSFLTLQDCIRPRIYMFKK